MTPESTNNESGPGPGLPPPPRRFRVSPRLMTTGAIIAVLALGAAGGAGANRYIQKHRPQAVLLLQPGPIATLKDPAAGPDPRRPRFGCGGGRGPQPLYPEPPAAGGPAIAAGTDRTVEGPRARRGQGSGCRSVRQQIHRPGRQWTRAD